jgi:hypothetical protein
VTKLKRVAGIRWANDVEVYKSILEHEEAIGSMVFQHSQHYALTHGIKLVKTDFENLERLHDILGKLRDFTREMEVDGPTGSLVLNMWLRLLHHLQDMQSKYDAHPDLVCALDAALLKAREYLQRAAGCRPILLATALNPQCRLLFFSRYPALNVSASAVRALLVEVCEQHATPELSPPSQSNEPGKGTATTTTFLCYNDSGDGDEEQSSLSLLEEEIEKYHANKRLKAGSAELLHDPLKWWQHNSGILPTLAQAARRYLSVLAAQAVTERLFSASDAVCNPRRMGNFKGKSISAQVGADQLLRNGYQAKGDWGEAQKIGARFKHRK